MPKGIVLTPEQQAERREKIVAVALSLMDENGFQKTSMRESQVYTIFLKRKTRLLYMQLRKK